MASTVTWSDGSLNTASAAIEQRPPGATLRRFSKFPLDRRRKLEANENRDNSVQDWECCFDLSESDEQ